MDLTFILSNTKFLRRQRPVDISSESNRSSSSEISEQQSADQNRIIVVWPQRRQSYAKKELTFVVWLIAHTLFWLHVTNLLPCGAGIVNFIILYLI